MSSSEANVTAPALLRFATAELLEGWLSAVDTENADLRLRAWRIVARPGIVQVLLRHRERLPPLRELYFVMHTTKSLVQADTISANIPQRQAVAPVRSNTAPAACLSTDSSVANGAVHVGTRYRSASQSAFEDRAISVRKLEEDIPPHLLLALVDVVAVVDCHLPSGNARSTVSHQVKAFPLEEMAETIRPLLDVVYGDFCVVLLLREWWKGQVFELRLRLPSQVLVLPEEIPQHQFEEMLLAFNPATLVMEIDQEDCYGLLSILVRTSPR